MDIFKGLKVVELANVLAGPAVGMFFSELGATVVKVENKKSKGDVTRSWKLSTEDRDSPLSAYYASVNWNKQSIMADLTQQEDREKIYSLIREADIVISNYTKGDDEKLGMSDRQIRAINPSVIHGRISGFGNESGRIAYDLVLQAETGFMYMNGTPESGPLKMPVALIDVLAAHQLKEGLLVALIKRGHNGEGSLVDVSLYDAAVASLANQASNWLMAGHDPKPQGSLHPNIAPYGETFLSRDDKMIVLAVGSDPQFRKLCEFLAPGLWREPFLRNTDRISHRRELKDLLQARIATMDAEMLMKGFLENEIPAGLVRKVSEVLSGPQAEGSILRETREHMETARVRTVVFSLK